MVVYNYMEHRKLPRKKRSIIWKLPDSDFIKLVKNSHGIGGVLKYFGFDNIGRNHHIVKERISELNIDTSHFNPFIRNKDKKHLIPIEEMLVENYNRSVSHLRNRIMKIGFLGHICNICGIGNYWNNKILVLQLDHINGIRTDNRIENLRVLCPNCHTQTDTFAGKNNKK